VTHSIPIKPQCTHLFIFLFFLPSSLPPSLTHSLLSLISQSSLLIIDILTLSLSHPLTFSQ
jgi:hypothetical protein